MPKTPESGDRKPVQRRALLRWTLAAPLVGLAAVAAGARAQQCVSEDDLSPSEVSLRASLRYEAKSTDPAKVCGGCAFFTAQDAGCGQCKLLNGPVTAVSRCSSWAPSPK